MDVDNTLPTAVPVSGNNWARGAMDNASDYGSEDSRFESWRARTFQKFFYDIIKHRKIKMLLDPDETRTLNLLIRSQTPYPLGHRASTQII